MGGLKSKRSVQQENFMFCSAAPQMAMAFTDLPEIHVQTAEVRHFKF